MSKLKRHEIPESSSINITPLLDVIFQLLVFFVLTSSLTRPTQIELQLPESSSGVKSPDRIETVVVTYRLSESRPVITLNAEAVEDLDALGAALRAMKTSTPPPPMDIQIDKTAPYQNVVTLIDTVRDAGFSKFALLTLASTQTPSK